MLTLPASPLLVLILIGAFLYLALKGAGKRRTQMTEEEYIQAVIRGNEQSRKEQEERLAEHRRRQKEAFNRKFGRTG